MQKLRLIIALSAGIAMAMFAQNKENKEKPKTTMTGVNFDHLFIPDSTWMIKLNTLTGVNSKINSAAVSTNTTSQKPSPQE